MLDSNKFKLKYIKIFINEIEFNNKLLFFHQLRILGSQRYLDYYENFNDLIHRTLESS